VWTVGGDAFATAASDTPVLSVAVSELPETIEHRFFADGHANNAVKFWTIDDEALEVVALISIRPTAQPIRKIGVGEGAMKVVVAQEALRDRVQ
jgi:hypothetical protein